MSSWDAAAARVELVLRDTGGEADGRIVALVREHRQDGWAVYCEVGASDTPPWERVRRGPYIFGSEREANEFLEDVSLALEYLGCQIR
jgi:hypothetical protein